MHLRNSAYTESTLAHLDKLTSEIGLLMRQFRDVTCQDFTTFELPRETEARNRRKQSSEKGMQGGLNSGAGRKSKIFNLLIYKWHALADYVCTIRLFGGTDGFSTQIVSLVCNYCVLNASTSFFKGELAHRIVKRLYGLTNKRKATGQIAKRWRRLEKARNARDRQLIHLRLRKPTKTSEATIDADEDEGGDSDLRYHISASKNHQIELMSHLRHKTADPAYSVCFFFGCVL